MKTTIDTEIRSGISTALIECREAHDMTQTEAGAIVGVSKTTYATWEQGRSMPNVDTLFRLAQYYHVSMDRMYGIEDKEK